MLGSSVKINPFLRKLLIPFFVITFALIAADLILSIVGAYTSLTTSVVLPVIYLILSIAFFVFYLVTARRIVLQLRKTELMKAASDTHRIAAIKSVNITFLILRFFYFLITSL